MRPVPSFASAWTFAAILMCALLALTACAPASPGASSNGTGGAQPTAKKRFAAVLLKPDLLSMRDDGADRVEEFAKAGLGRIDIRGDTHPQLAEAVPSVENGLWQVLPDGKMETTWRIRQDARWQDGTPVTSADYIFGTTVDQDKELPWTVSAAYNSVESITASDSQTVIIRWKQIYIDADSFSGSHNRLLPKHLLESVYTENKHALPGHAYWTDRFMHAGPFMVRDYQPDSHVLLQAFDGYVLGRPRIDEVEIKFIQDQATMVANLLAGTIDVTLGLTLSPEEAANLRNTWTAGTTYTSPVFGSSVGIMPQFINPNPPVVGDLRFRRAMAHALDRQEMVDTIVMGQTAVAHAIVGGTPFENLDRVVTRYEFDPRRANQLMEELGYRKGGDGNYQDSAGRQLAMDVWGIQEEQERVKGTLASEAYWRRFGVTTNLVLIPAAQRDLELRSTWPAFFNRGISGGISAIQSYFHSSRVATPANGFRGGNGPRYVNAELDSLIDRSLATIPKTERQRIVEGALGHLAENVICIGLFYTPYNAAVSNRMVNVTTSSAKAIAWDNHLWDIRN